MTINVIKSIWNKLRSVNKKLTYRAMEVDDIEFILSSLRLEAQNGHFTAAFLDDIEYSKYYTMLMFRANNQIVKTKSSDGSIQSLINFFFVFENQKNEKLGFIELSETQEGDFCRDTLEFENVEIMALVVAEKYRGQGYAERFISMSLKELPVKKTIFARCLKPSIKMVKIFERLGFSCINTTPRGSKWMELRVRN